MKQQILMIHGGETFESREEVVKYIESRDANLEDRKRYSSWLKEELKSTYQIVNPLMPNHWDAKYPEWKLWFEKHLEIMDKELILIGSSLGGIFIAKYLSENKIDKRLKGVFLVAAPFDDVDSEYSLATFRLINNLENLKQYQDILTFYHSTDDPCVPYRDLEKYKKLLPEAKYITFEDRGHFWQGDFPEILEDIKGLAN